jgi:1-acyl-sn-glycerol-3-phosphate acyltransferase
MLNSHQGPMIIISNHPNTMIDGWLIGKICKKQPFYLAKGTFFNKPWKKRVLMSLGMIPVNRQIDGQTTGVNNGDSFEACYRVLEETKTLVIFPEGNSFQERGLRELKTGTARIALEVQQRNGGKLDLVIVPVGLFYTQAHRFRSSVLVNVGEPIRVDEYFEQYAINSKLAAHGLTDEFRKIMEALLVLTSGAEREKLLEELIRILYNGDSDSVEQHAERLRTLDEILANTQLTDPDRSLQIQNLIQAYVSEKEQLSLRDEYIGKQGNRIRFLGKTALSVLFLILGLPFFLFGFVHSIVPFRMTDFIVPRLTKAIEYYAPLAILLGLLLYPMNYVLFVGLVSSMVNLSIYEKALYFFAMPITGLYAFYYFHLVQAFFKRIRFLYRRNGHLAEIGLLKGIRMELLKLIEYN